MPRVATTRIAVDPETYAALSEHAESIGENVTAVVRDVVRAYLQQYGYTFATEPLRPNRRGSGRRTE